MREGVPSPQRAGGTWLVLLGLPAIAALAAGALWQPLPRLVWNASASMPIGLYALAPGQRVRRGDIVAVELPPGARALAADRGYLPARLPALKRVAAVPGDRVCAAGAGIAVDGQVVALRLPRDGLGRVLAWWQGCGVLLSGVLLLGEGGQSFDGRYFGPVASERIIGVANLLWRR